MLVGERKFHSWGRCTIALTNMHSGLRSNPSSGLCINIYIYILFMLILYFYADRLFCILGCNNLTIQIGALKYILVLTVVSCTAT